MGWTLWVAFAALCTLSGTSWAIPGGLLELPKLEEQGLLFGAIGMIAFLFAGRGMWARVGNLRWRRLAIAGAGFFGIPIVAVEYARGSVPGTSRSALFAMIPIVIALVVTASDTTAGEERSARQALVPALVGLGGLLLLLPLGFSGSVRGWIMLGVVGAAVVVVGVASVWMYRLLREFGLVDAIAIVGLVNAFFLLAVSAARQDVVWRWSEVASVVSASSLVDVVEVLLIVWLLREMMPIRFAARYLLIPLITVLESYVLMRPEWTVRMGAGTVLLAIGGGMLLFLKSSDEEAVLSLR